MGHVEVVAEEGNYRAVIEHDEMADKPDWDAQAPIFQIEDYYGNYGVSELMGDDKEGDKYRSAYEHFVSVYGREGIDVFERYMKIFHGCLKFEEYNVGTSREYGYIAFDTAA